ncbi:MAG: recombination regulator RecX [Spirochaetales bacterium]|nr:recombination regulator RecX [Spirochaetales bacterium]
MGRLQGLVQRSMRTFVTVDAADILSRRDHSAAELFGKLRRKGYDKESCRFAVEALHERGYQDDRRFADMWVRSAMRGRGKSRGALLAGLAERGVDRDVAEDAISTYEADHPDCFDIALQNALSRVSRGDETDRERIIRRLTRAGFPLVHIKKHFT